MEDCIFCKIIRGEIPSQKVYEDDLAYAFRDINPQMPVHVLVVPKAHIASAAELTEEDAPVVGHLFAVMAKLAKGLGLERGYRVITNVGEEAGQTVKHLHFHLLAGDGSPDCPKMGEKLV